MRTIERSTAFKRDYKRESRGRHAAILDTVLAAVLPTLQSDTTLELRYRDHDLIGEWQGHRECHLRPDLLLIYRKQDDLLSLIRIGSHSELFG